MKIGAIFPTTEIGSDPAAVRDWAQAAEGLGFSHMIAYDHVLGVEHANRDPKLIGPYTENHPFHEPFVLFGYLAGLTSSIEMCTGVLILPQRQTALVAKQAAEVDVLSGGRLRLGVGTGWNWVEYDSLAVPYKQRGKRMDEQVEVLRELWKAKTIDFSGDYHRIERAGILPSPTRSIPIWFGGFADVAFQRAARIGDGFQFGAAGPVFRAHWEQVKEGLEKAGRSVEDFGAEVSVDFSHGPDVWRTEFEAWQEAGGTHFSLRAMDTAAELVGAKLVGYKCPQDYIDALEQFAKVVL